MANQNRLAQNNRLVKPQAQAVCSTSAAVPAWAVCTECSPLDCRHITARTEKRPRTLAVEIWHRDVRILRRSNLAQKGGGQRGKISHMSKHAIQRMRWFLINCPDLDKIGQTAFGCLTYPAVFPTDGREVKQHLHAMIDRWRRRGISGAWCLEFQERGAPHIHFVLTKAMAGPDLRAMWFRIVGSGDYQHFKHGAWIAVAREPDAVARYLANDWSKRAQKTVPEGFLDVGRFWGHWGLTETPERIERQAAVDIARFARRAAIAARRSEAKERKFNEACSACEADLREDGRSGICTDPGDVGPGRVHRPRRDNGTFSHCVYGVAEAVRQLLNRAGTDGTAAPARPERAEKVSAWIEKNCKTVLARKRCERLERRRRDRKKRRDSE